MHCAASVGTGGGLITVEVVVEAPTAIVPVPAVVMVAVLLRTPGDGKDVLAKIVSTDTPAGTSTLVHVTVWLLP